ncbi:hypothetical protein [Metabacillus fastidiosus]|uniref:Uncharacterized protein n=1 Tax=Metabacillus fastidiosus TaxID=1458 RepID=A0ABU6NU99_9BACI|nr:hypothetical protein [Metabacillus fastidiosus]MED4400278.1 hypothetical protein [Metabacillus fastidiosus]
MAQELNFYWLIVIDKETGVFHNAQILDKSKRPINEVLARFERKFPRYVVVEGGEGLENRPEIIRDLPLIENYL